MAVARAAAALAAAEIDVWRLEIGRAIDKLVGK